MSKLKSNEVNNKTPAARKRGKKITKKISAKRIPNRRKSVAWYIHKVKPVASTVKRSARLAAKRYNSSMSESTIREEEDTVQTTNMDASENIEEESPCSTSASALLDSTNQLPREIAGMSVLSQSVIERNIAPAAMTLGFLGLGTIGATIAKNLVFNGYKVVIWNRTKHKLEPLIRAGAVAAKTPMAVVEKADVTFCCVSEPHASKDLVFGKYGVLQVKNLRNKAYVELSTLDPDTSQEIGAAITRSNGRYLEAQMDGTRQNAYDGTLTILAAGDRTVFDDCKMIFKLIGKLTIYLDAEMGKACKFHLIFQVIHSTSMIALAEALSLADSSGVILSDVMKIVQLSAMSSPFLLSKGKEIIKKGFSPEQPLADQQKNLNFALTMADSVKLSMPITKITNEQFKLVDRFGYGQRDSSVRILNSQI